MSTLPNRPLALVVDGDSLFLDIVGVSPKTVRLARIIRYPNNQNGKGVEENFRDLEPMTKRQVIAQINRKYAGMSIIT